ncbi:hypothetical protein CP982_07150 [Streptomyces spectabilis]|uniref:Uncharacterized protein n=1 Tax=Streptomyces spectabilis TaxID=68270 RepID=A0A5P2X652_STRST|nr:hypothetical protein CP982_07150 [Streptomyces spectabilis]
MPPSPPSRGCVRSVEEINRRIRALWPHRDARLSREDRAVYEQLLEEWAHAIREGVVEAA